MLQSLGIVLVKIVSIGACLYFARMAIERLGHYYSKQRAKEARRHLHLKRVLNHSRTR